MLLERPSLIVSVHPFPPFPKLVTLNLRGVYGPPLPLLLDSLASSCPLLETLNFPDSYWLSDLPSPSFPADFFPELRVLAQLRKFKHLKSVNLGILPTIDQDDYSTLKEELGGAGVRVSHDVCVAEVQAEEAE
jgi:hypothetical protein